MKEGVPMTNIDNINAEEQENAFLKALKSFIPSNELQGNDYMKGDIMYCGNCHTPMRTYVDVPLANGTLIKQLVPQPCDCRLAEIRRKEAAEKKRKARELSERFRKEGLSEMVWHNATFTNDDKRDKNASAVCKKYVDNFSTAYEKGTGLLLYGGLGSGKTYLAACVANKLIDNGIPVLMASLPNLISRMTVDYGAKRLGILERIQNIPLLAIDDFGVEHDSPYMITQVYELVNARYVTGKPLLVTTNKTLSELRSESSLDLLRVYERVLERNVPLRVRGESRRKGIAHKTQREFEQLLGIDSEKE